MFKHQFFVQFDFIFIGPGQYRPEKSKLDHGPEYSFGLKPNIDKPDQVPGPGQYNPKILDQTPQYSFGIRPDIDKPSDIPGKITKYFANFLHKF